MESGLDPDKPSPSEREDLGNERSRNPFRADFWNRRRVLIASGLGAALVALGVVSVITLKDVPDVRGLQVSKAVEELNAAGFDNIEVDARDTAEVCDQSPDPGSDQAFSGDKITLQAGTACKEEPATESLKESTVIQTTTVTETTTPEPTTSTEETTTSDEDEESPQVELSQEEIEDALMSTCGDIASSLDGDGQDYLRWSYAVAKVVNSSSIPEEKVASNAGKLYALECVISENESYRPADNIIEALEERDGRLFD